MTLRIYSYPDIDALLVESIALQIECFVEPRRELADTLGDPRDKLVAATGCPAACGTIRLGDGVPH